MPLEEIEQIIEIEINSLSFFYFGILIFDKLLYTYNRGGIVKCDKCGKTIDADALSCPFCDAEIKAETEEIEVLGEEETNVVEESGEPSIISSEEISIDTLNVETPKKKKKKKKKGSKEKEGPETEETHEISAVPMDGEAEITEEAVEEKKEEEKLQEGIEDDDTEKYEPFVDSEDVVPLPPKKTLLYRIKDFYHSWFEGYEKAPEIKVDDRETRLTLEKIYEKSSKEAAAKPISANDVSIVWLACFVLAFILFFILTTISFIIDIIVGEHNNNSLLTMIIPVFQIGLPVFLITFGWLIGIVYSYIKRKTNRNK